MNEFDLWDALSKARSELMKLQCMIAEDDVPTVASNQHVFYYGEELKDPRKVALLYQVKRVEDALPMPQAIRQV